MASKGEPNSRKFKDICLKLSRSVPANKLKQLKFLLQDVASGIDICDQKTFLDLIRMLEAQAILNHVEPSRDEASLLCELLDAVSLYNLANEICSEFLVERDPLRHALITPFRKFLVKLSDELNQDPLIQKMKEYLQSRQDIFCYQDASSLDVFQAMIQACLITPYDLSALKEMMVFCSRSDLVQRIDKFNCNAGVFKKVPYGLRNLPRDMVERSSEVGEILDLLRAGNSQVGVVGVRIGDIIGIRGMGGIGKTVLAQAIAWSVSIHRHVIWLDIGQTPVCLALLNTLVKALGGKVSFSDIPGAQAWVRENTVNKDCLVVLDDVWNVEHASVFDYLSGKCQLLITTRDADVVRGLKGSAIYELQIMPQDKSRVLLYQSAQVTADEQSKLTSNMQRIVVELLEQCRGLPLALSLVGCNLTDTRIEQDWQDILDDLKNADLTELRSLFPTDAYPYDNLLAAINVSFQRLKENEREKFLDFAIFPEDTDIPSDILELFWSSKGSRGSPCSARVGRRILNVLERKSLIQKGPVLHGKNSYRVHDLLLDFARGMLGLNSITDAQCEFLEALRGKCVNWEWPKFTGNRDYFFQYLPYHLNSSGQYGELIKLFFDFQWLVQKVKETNLPSLISDFRFLGTASHEIKLLKSSLMLSADIIEKSPDSIGPQLLGRLLSCADEYPSVKTLLECVRETCSTTCHIVPLISCLSEPVGPLIKIFNKHKDKVLSLTTSVNPSGNIVISGSTDRSIKIHELETGKEVQVLEGHTMAVYSLALSHSGTMLASGSYDSSTRIWNMDSFEQQFVLEAQGGFVNAVDFSADDQRLFTGSNDGQLRVWRVSTGELLNTIPAHNGHIRGLCTTKDGQHIATASLDHTIKVWRADTLNNEATLTGHTDTVYAVVATSDSRMLVSAAGDKTLKIWDLQKYQEVRTLHGDQGEIYSAAVSDDSKHILSGGKDMIVRLWCFHTGKLLFNFKGHSQSIRAVTILSDGSKALSGSQDKSFRVWDLDTSAYLKHDGSRGHSEDVMDIAMTQDGSRCVSSCMDGTLKIWKCETAEECFTLRGHTKRAISVAISADGRHVVSLAKDSLIKVWDLYHGNEIVGTVGDKQCRLVRFNPTGELVLIGCKNNCLYFWDWQNYDVPINCVTLPAFTTMEIACDKDVVYTCSRNNEICQIDLRSLQVFSVSQGPNPTCTSMVILPKGEAILSGIVTDNVFIYWELSSWREIRYNADHADDSIVTAIDITSDGKLALSGGSSGTVSLVNLESSKVVKTYANTEAGVGIRLVSVLRDDVSFVLVDEANRVELRNLDNHDHGVLLGQPPVKVACVAPLGLKYILLGCVSGELLLFDHNEGFNHEYKQQAHDVAVSQVKSHPSNDFLYFASGSENGSVKLWYVTKTAPPWWSQMWSHDNVHSHPITALAFLPGSEDIVCGSYGNEVHRINATGTVRTYQYKSYGVAALRVVEDTLVAAYIRGFSVVKWRLSNGDLTEKVHGGAGREQVSRFHLPFSHVVSKGSHHSLLCWNLQTGATIHRLRGHSHDIRTLAFVPGGERILSGSRDKTLILWNLRTGRFVEEFDFERYVLAIACAPNGIVCVGLQGGQVCFLRINSLASPAIRTV